MKAAILVEQKKPLIVDEVRMPDDLDVGQVLIRILYTGICGSQIGEIKGIKGADKFLPHLLGHEASAEVLATGLGVTNVKKGDIVVAHWKKGNGIEAKSPNYMWRDNILNAGKIATFNEYAVVSENRLTTIDPISNLKVAALFGCAITTGFGVIENNAEVKVGESLVVFGSGGVGLNIIQAGSLRGANPIIAVDQFSEKLKFAKKMGATHCIDSSINNAFMKINEIVGKNNINVFVDNTGDVKVIENAYKNISSNGRIILVGVPSFAENINIHSLDLHFGKKIIGTEGGNSNPSLDIPRLYNASVNMHENLENIITNIIKLDDINEAIEALIHGRISGRVLIKF
jgi:Zn-dependent alcohol dehydrogenase